MWMITVLSSFGPTFVYDERNAGRNAEQIKTFETYAAAAAFAEQHWPPSDCRTKIVEL